MKAKELAHLLMLRPDDEVNVHLTQFTDDIHICAEYQLRDVEIIHDNGWDGLTTLGLGEVVGDGCFIEPTSIDKIIEKFEQLSNVERDAFVKRVKGE